jgi:hypothetical protein
MRLLLALAVSNELVCRKSHGFLDIPHFFGNPSGCRNTWIVMVALSIFAFAQGG